MILVCAENFTVFCTNAAISVQNVLKNVVSTAGKLLLKVGREMYPLFTIKWRLHIFTLGSNIAPSHSANMNLWNVRDLHIEGIYAPSRGNIQFPPSVCP